MADTPSVKPGRRIVTLVVAVALAAIVVQPGRAERGKAMDSSLIENKIGRNLPQPWPTPFQGTIAEAPALSKEDYPRLPVAPRGAPNILLILTDDVGFGAASAFGGPIPTPNLERLAARGLAYNQFHTTAMCSPTRAALLTGRNHHNVGTGVLTDFAGGYPGYNSFLPKNAATIAEVLRDNGYATAWFGKDHNIPFGQLSAAGPFTQWPTSIGFDYFFGFVGSETDQWHPQLFRGVTRVSDHPVSDILDKRLADDAINWIHNEKGASPEKPFFIYYATGSGHTPHQAPKEWIARFRGQFDKGWDAIREETLARQKHIGMIPPDTRLSPRPSEVPAWDRLSADEKLVQARLMEVNAAMVAYQDAQIGRVLDEIDRMRLGDNTLVIFVEGDNGADAAGSPEGELTETGEMANKRSTLAQRLAHIDEFGGPNMQTNYSTGWAVAMNTPFPFYKQVASHLGGTRNGLVISWPEKIAKPGIRPQYHHVIDIMPTILDSAGIVSPETVNGIKQKPLDGVSMTYSFDHPHAESHRQVQYYEMLGNRAIYHHGWLASTSLRKQPWNTQDLQDARNLAENYSWELYNLDTDFSQTTSIATKYPRKLAQMKALFEREARKYQVLPLDDREGARLGAMGKIYVPPRSNYVYWGKNITMSTDVAPPLANRSFAIEAHIRTPSRATGVIAALGSRFGGWVFYLKDGRPAVAENLAGLPDDEFKLAAAEAVPADRPATIRFDFDYDGGGVGKGGIITISLDGKRLAQKRLGDSIVSPGGISETFDIGLDRGVTVADDYEGNGLFPGEIDKVIVSLGQFGKQGVN